MKRNPLAHLVLALVIVHILDAIKADGLFGGEMIVDMVGALM